MSPAHRKASDSHRTERVRARRLSLAAWSLALPLVACSDDRAPGAPWEGKNVLFITIDTLRPDHMSLYGYERATSPRIDAFFGAGDVYSRAYSTESATAPSVVSFLSGLYPQNHGVRLLYQKLEPDLALLPDYLKSAGYATAGIVSNSVLTGEASDLARHFDYYDDFVDEREENRDIFERRAQRTTDAALYWFGEKREPDTPHLLWVHYIDPHGPYDAPAGKPAAFTHETPRPIDVDRVRRYQRIDGTDDGNDYVDRYDEEIAYMDREVGRLLDAYASQGRLDETVVVFTADHGETMMDHEQFFTHGYHVWEAMVRVPLMIHAPGSSGRTHDQSVSLVDLVPTLLANLGVDCAQSFDGLHLGERSETTTISVESVSGKVMHRARIRGTKKWFVTIARAGGIQKDGWIDLAQDDETTERLRKGAPDADGSSTSTEIDEGWKELLEWVDADPDRGGIPADLLEGTRLDGPKVAPGRSQEQLEALRRLGYVE